MARFVRGFVITDVAEVHAAFRRVILDAERLVVQEREARRSVGAAGLLFDLRVAYRDFSLGLRMAAVHAAAQATRGMRDRLRAGQVRPDTGTSPRLESLVSAVPLQAIGGFETGAVGVADIEQLNRAINPNSRGYGTFWRAQEYGTGQGGVPSQVGRILYGSFTGPGGSNPSAPDPQHAGGGGPHPIFRSGYTPSGGGDRVSGLGTISHEIQPKHFIKFGADEASVQWRREIQAVQQRALEELRGIRLGGS